MAVALVQEAGSTSSSAATTLACSWGSATTTGNLLVLGISVAVNSLSVTLTPPAGWTLIDTAVTALNGANPITTTALYYKKNAASESGSKTFTFSQSVNASMFLSEWSGADPTAPLDVTSSNTQTATTTLVSGTTAATSQAAEVAIALISENSNFTLSTPTNGFTLQDNQKSAASGTARISGAFLYKILAATGAQSTGVTSTGTNPAASKIATFKAASGATVVQWTSMGITAGPQQFPLGPPDMSGATTLTDPNADAVWAPALTNGVDYILNAPNLRSRQLKIVGGRNVVVPKLLLTYKTIADNEMVYLAGGDTGRIVHFGVVHLDPNGLQSDAFKTHSPFDGRHLQIKICRVEKLIGHTGGTHADLVQTSGGIGDTWIEDFTGYTTYDGFMHQREANLEGQTVFFNVTAASSAGGNYTYTTSVAHGYSPGDAISVYNVSGGSNAFYGGYTILSTTTFTFTCQRGDTASPVLPSAGVRCAKMAFGYSVGSINLNRVNVKGFTNAFGDPTEALQSIRFGARTAPKPNDGGAALGGYPVSHVNEDQTPLNIDQWAGSLAATNWYAEPVSGDVGGFVEPDEGTSNYSGIRPVFHAAAGGQPAYADWPLHPNVTGKIQQGPPPGGDFVIMQGGLPTATVASTGSAGVTAKATVFDARIAVAIASNFPNAYDNFTRSVGAGGLGSADLGGTYTLTGTAADFSVNGSQAVIAVTAAAQNKVAVLSNITMLNQYVTATMQTDTSPAGSYTAFDLYLRYVNSSNWYRCRVALNPSGTVQIKWDRNLAGVLTTINAFVLTPLSGTTLTDYSILAQAVGTSPTTLNAYVWNAVAPPPQVIPFQVGASDSSAALQAVSAAGFGAGLNSGSTATATKVSTTYWDAFPTRWTASAGLHVAIADAKIAVPIFASPGTGSKHRWTPR